MENKKLTLEDFRKMSREEMQQFQVDSYNSTEGDLHLEDGVNCEVCKNKGSIQYIKDNITYYKDCECMHKRNQISRARASGLGEYIGKKSKDYIVEEEWQDKHKKKLIEFCKNHGEDNTWFITVGSSGCGKTLMCSIIANHLLFNLNRNVIYMTWTDFISRLKRDMMSEEAKNVSRYLDDIKNCDVLFMDELLKKYNETDLKYLIEIINYRYQNRLKTLITSERLIDELLDIDEATFSRAIEMCDGFFINTPKDRRKNYRLRKIDIS